MFVKVSDIFLSRKYTKKRAPKEHLQQRHSPRSSKRSPSSGGLDNIVTDCRARRGGGPRGVPAGRRADGVNKHVRLHAGDAGQARPGGKVTFG